MTRFEKVAAIAALSVVSVAAASAAAADSAQRYPARAVYVCEKTDAAERDWERRYGEPMRFVSAEEAKTSKERWAKPRCITDRELARYEADRRKTLVRASRD